MRDNQGYQSIIITLIMVIFSLLFMLALNNDAMATNRYIIYRGNRYRKGYRYVYPPVILYPVGNYIYYLNGNLLNIRQRGRQLPSGVLLLNTAVYPNTKLLNNGFRYVLVGNQPVFFYPNNRLPNQSLRSLPSQDYRDTVLCSQNPNAPACNLKAGIIGSVGQIPN